MKVTIIGTGDVKIISENTSMNQEELEELLSDTARFLVEIVAEIIILPARGISYEFAKLYKKFGGEKVNGVIPFNCPFYGEHTDKIIGDFIDVVDEKIEFDSWYDVDGNIATLGDYTICFGLSTGVLAEIALMKYNLMYKGRKTKLIIFEKTISKRLHKEVEEEVKPVYVDSVEELKETLK